MSLVDEQRQWFKARGLLDDAQRQVLRILARQVGHRLDGHGTSPHAAERPAVAAVPAARVPEHDEVEPRQLR